MNANVLKKLWPPKRFRITLQTIWYQNPEYLSLEMFIFVKWNSLVTKECDNLSAQQRQTHIKYLNTFSSDTRHPALIVGGYNALQPLEQ
jgi:hypothetical protein